MSPNQGPTIAIAALTFIGCVLVALGLFAGGSIEIVALGLGAVVVAAVLGTATLIFGGRRS